MLNKYDAVFSLGSNCSVANQIKRKGCRKCAGPLDWVVSQDAQAVVDLLNSSFKDYMLYENLEILGEHEHCYKVRDKKYNIISVHDFENSKPLKSSYFDFRTKIDRRIKRFLEMALSLDKVLFIREHANVNEVIQIKTAINHIKPNNNHKLIIVNSHFDNHLIHYDYVNGIPFFDILQVDECWSGYNCHWDMVLNNISIGSNTFETYIDSRIEKIYGFYDEEEGHVWATDNCFFRIFNCKGKTINIEYKSHSNSKVKLYNCADDSEIHFNYFDIEERYSERKKLNFVVPNNDCLVQFTVSDRYDAPNDSRILGVCFFKIQVQ